MDVVWMNHLEATVYFSPLSPQEVLVLIWLTSEGWKAESTLKPPSGLEPGAPLLGIQRPYQAPFLHSTI